MGTPPIGYTTAKNELVSLLWTDPFTSKWSWQTDKGQGYRLSEGPISGAFLKGPNTASANGAVSAGASGVAPAARIVTRGGWCQ